MLGSAWLDATRAQAAANALRKTEEAATQAQKADGELKTAVAAAIAQEKERSKAALAAVQERVNAITAGFNAKIKEIQDQKEHEITAAKLAAERQIADAERRLEESKKALQAILDAKASEAQKVRAPAAFAACVVAEQTRFAGWRPPLHKRARRRGHRRHRGGRRQREHAQADHLHARCGHQVRSAAQRPAPARGL
jgi:hypothetical protein